MKQACEPALNDHKPFTQEHHSWFRENLVEGIQGPGNCSFMPYPVLKTRYDDYALVKIVKEQFGNQSLNFRVKDISEHGFLKVFCILLNIGKGQYIEHFLKSFSLSDQKLPFHPESEPPAFPSDPNDPKFFERFCDKQWSLCAPEFKNKAKSSYRKEEVLPITEKEFISQGGSADVFKIKLHKDYNKLVGLNKTQASSDEYYLLKQYHSKEHYNTEVDAFHRVDKSPHLRQFYMGYEQGETYNAIFEYADGTLEEYFQNNTPPYNDIDIYHFYKEIFGLIQAVKAIHEAGGGGQESLQGWHQDINPHNIVVKRRGGSGGSTYKYKFMLADLGHSHFKSKAASPGQVTDVDSSGTITYGAPETYRPNPDFYKTRLYVTSGVDIFSLVAVFSEAVIWVVSGKEGLDIDRRSRGAATEKIPKFRGGNCFHDGHKVLGVVETTHENLKRIIRQSDFFSNNVWGKLIQPSFQHYMDSDWTAVKLWRISDDVLNEGFDTMSRERGDSSLPAIVSKNSGKRIETNFGKQPTGGAQSSSPNEYTVVQAFAQEQGTQDSRQPVFSESNNHTNDAKVRRSSSRHVHQANDYCEPSTAVNRNIGSFESSDSRSSNSKGPTTPVDPVIGLSYARSPTTPPSPPERTPPRKEMVVLPMKDAISWSKSRLKCGGRLARFFRRIYRPWSSQRSPPIFHHIEEQVEKFQSILIRRDHVFLIDDSSNMETHWEDMRKVVPALGAILGECKYDRIRLYFTSSAGYKDCKITALGKVIGDMTPQSYPDMKTCLGDILDRYRSGSQKTFLRSSKQSAPLTIYIFTNGAWNDNNVNEPIENTVIFLDDQHLNSFSVGIQFIRFGTDEEGGKRLNHLDKGLGLKRDIVDTEPADGNVWKMLLGSIDKYIDADEKS